MGPNWPFNTTMQRPRFEYLVEKELGDHLSDEERHELDAVLSSSPELLQEYQLLKQYWLDKRSHSVRDQELFQRVLQRIDSPAPANRRFFSNSFLAKIAAAIAVFFVLFSGIFYRTKSGENELHANRNQRTITLEDGTEVILNAKSTLYYPDEFAEEKREVRIVGEAFFRVAKEQGRPFIIETERARLKVLGTSFNVRAYPDERTTEASLIEGSLEVTAREGDSRPVLLRPTEKIILPNKSPERTNVAEKPEPVKLSKISFLNSKDSTAVETTWTRNKLAFKDVSFADLSKVLERKYDVQFVFTGTSAPKLRFTASFDKEDMTQMLTALQMASSFRYRIENRKITIVD